jgi:lipopolysaccharide assembly outer membrane protein LptD (OstA)
MLARYAIFVMMVLLLSLQLHAKQMRIKGDVIIYDEATQTTTASGNAHVEHPEFTIMAETIRYNKQTDMVTGHTNVMYTANGRSMLSDSFELHVATNRIDINGLYLELPTKSGKHTIYVSANTFNSRGAKKVGTKGRFTTCDYDPPHYYFEADSFTILPEKRLIGHNVRFVNPVFGLPLGLWSPAYIFDLGKRKVIYLMPVIGSNRVEGGFFKSQIDYVLSDHWTGEAYMDYLSNLGIGTGTRLHYKTPTTLEGDLYYYGIPNTPYTIHEWNQTLPLSTDSTLVSHIQSKNMYVVQGSSVKTDTHRLQFNRSQIDRNQTIRYGFNQSHYGNQSPKTYTASLSERRDNGDSFSLNYNQTDSSTLSNSYHLNTTSKWLGYDITNTNQLSYYESELSATDSRMDSYLKTNHAFTRDLAWGQIRTVLDLYIDTDNDTVTRDIRNHVVQKLPEITLDLSRMTVSDAWTYHNQMQYGYYTESYYISSLNRQRHYEQSRFVSDQSLNGRYVFEFMNGNLSLNTAYKQFYYASGDQNFTLSQRTAYTTDSWSFLKTNTTYDRSWISENGNTPFYFDERNQLERNELRETILFYLKSDQKYALSYSSGYNWVVDYQLDNQYQLIIKPNAVFSGLFTTQYRIKQKKYTPLVSRIDIQPSERFSTKFQINYDLNEGKMTNLNHTISGSTSQMWEKRWLFDLYFIHSPDTNQNYQLQTLSLTKDLHERKLTLMYNRVMEEFRFQFTLNAFAENPLGITTNKYESFRFDGVFDDSSIQR